MVAPVLVVAGATGTGKSTLCRWLAERGASWIEADRVGHEVLETEEVRAALREDFGEEIFDEEGRVVRARLGERVFSDPAALDRLNRLVHPPLVAEIRRRIEVLRRSRGIPLIVVDAALHFQFEPRLECDLVLMTRVERSEQIRRVVERDGIDAAAAERRIERQAEVEASLPRADAVLDTDAAPGELRRRLLSLVDERLNTRFVESDPPRPDAMAPTD